MYRKMRHGTKNLKIAYINNRRNHKSKKEDQHSVIIGNLNAKIGDTNKRNMSTVTKGRR